LRIIRGCDAFDRSCLLCREIVVIEGLLQVLLQVLGLDVTRDWQVAQGHGLALIRDLWRGW
jgi:hypothetical protein